MVIDRCRLVSTGGGDEWLDVAIGDIRRKFQDLRLLVYHEPVCKLTISL